MQVFIALLKFDFFFFIGFSVQFIVIVASTMKEGNDKVFGMDYEFYVTIGALPVTLIFLLCAAWCTRREMRYTMWCVVAIFHAALAYFIFKLVRMYQPGYEDSYKPARRSLTTFGKFLPSPARNCEVFRTRCADPLFSCHHDSAHLLDNRKRNRLHIELRQGPQASHNEAEDER